MTTYEQIILKTEKGKYVTLKKIKHEWKLCIEAAQNSEVHKLTLWVHRKEGTGQNTFAFVWNCANAYYSPKVNGDRLELETLNTNCPRTPLSSSHWFEMRTHNAGNFYGLASVVKPGKQLSISNNKYLQISADDTKWVQFKDENQGQVFTTTC